MSVAGAVILLAVGLLLYLLTAGVLHTIGLVLVVVGAVVLLLIAVSTGSTFGRRGP
ncbi:MAG TPA: hypothetical protein VN213_02715 [Solirubrobacteraceae bacterium]|nr:hypothetical protein [Solirubrobacteraceae bacterium]